MSHTAHWAVAATGDQLQETKLVLGDFWSRHEKNVAAEQKIERPIEFYPRHSGHWLNDKLVFI